MRISIRRSWHKFVIWLFKQHINDVLVDCIHPEMGWLWHEDQQGGRALKESYESGWTDGYNEALKYVAGKKRGTR